MLAHLNLSNLTPAQLDGVACVVCHGEDGAMIPVGVVDGGQVFAHKPCVGDREPVALVIGSTTTDVDLDDLRALAHDVADRLRLPARIAVGRDYDVTDYECIVLADNFAEAYDSAVLGCEALTADVCTMWSNDLNEYAYSLQCGHCFEDDTDARPRLVGDTWTAPVCSGCVAVHARGGLVSAVPLAA